jgi:hypothetical protein
MIIIIVESAVCGDDCDCDDHGAASFWRLAGAHTPKE